jgi:hypothetical protein
VLTSTSQVADTQAWLASGKEQEVIPGGGTAPVSGLLLRQVPELVNPGRVSPVHRAGLDFTQAQTGTVVEVGTDPANNWKPRPVLTVEISVNVYRKVIRALVAACMPVVVLETWYVGKEVARRLIRIPLLPPGTSTTLTRSLARVGVTKLVCARSVAASKPSHQRN